MWIDLHAQKDAMEQYHEIVLKRKTNATKLQKAASQHWFLNEDGWLKV